MTCVARQPVPLGEREQRDELLRPPRRPLALLDLALAEHDAEPSEQLDARRAHLAPMTTGAASAKVRASAIPTRG